MDTDTDSARRVLQAIKAEARKYRMEKLQGRMASKPPDAEAPPLPDEEAAEAAAPEGMAEDAEAPGLLEAAKDAAATPEGDDDEAALMEIRKLLARC